MRCAQIDPEFQQLVGWGVPSLTTYAVEVRYDAPLFPSIAETEHAVALAEQVRNFVRAKLSEKGYGGNS
jgi:hypothetical protein